MKSYLSLRDSNTNSSFFNSALILSLLFIIVGCATPKEKGVKVGMSMDEVQSLIGAPTRIKKMDCPENARNCSVIWHYDGSNVVFVDGIVETTQ